MEVKNNIIAIRKESLDNAYLLFRSYMNKVETYINNDAQLHPTYYRELTPIALEKHSVEVMRKACDNTPFRSEEIKLVSGASFPDIVAEKYYGVEVKSTKSNHWTTIGGSIAESTRIQNVTDIYLLFGNLGGMPPTFKARPYQECLYDITVTHSPRYLINMDLQKEETIFDKMGTSYDKFRTSKNPIATIQHYYRNKAISEKKGELPWWLSEQNEQNSIMVKSFKSLPRAKKDNLTSIMLLLFNQAIIRGQYDEVTVWLLSSQNVINSSLRDLFSAGGRLKHVKINGVTTKLDKPLPAIVKRLISAGIYIKSNHKKHLNMLDLYNPLLLKNDEVYTNWINQTEKAILDKYLYLDKKDIPLHEWIEYDAILIS